MSNILIVLSAADSWTRPDGSANAIGVWAEKLVDIDETFGQAGVWVEIATPGVVRATKSDETHARRRRCQVPWLRAEGVTAIRAYGSVCRELHRSRL